MILEGLTPQEEEGEKWLVEQVKKDKRFQAIYKGTHREDTSFPAYYLIRTGRRGVIRARNSRLIDLATDWELHLFHEYGYNCDVSPWPMLPGPKNLPHFMHEEIWQRQ